MAKVKLEHVTKRFGSVLAVDSLSLVVEEGEFVAILGPSGCGKTTTLNMIVGLERPTEGHIIVDGMIIDHLPPQRRNIGMVFQDYAIFPHMTAFDNIAFGLKIRKAHRDQIEREVLEIARVLQLEQALWRPATSLNQSELQRIAIARTLVTRPALILFDEPLSNLEASLRLRMRTELKEIQSRLGFTAIYVTHDQVEAMSLAHRIAVMNRGRLQQYDEPLTIYRNPRNRFVAGFIGNPPMNILRCRHVQLDGAPQIDCGDFCLDAHPFTSALAKASGPDLWLGIRPEDVRLATDQVLAPGFVVHATVYGVEPLGAETIVDYQIGTQIIRSLARGTFLPRTGERLPLFLDPRKLRLFDGATDEALVTDN